MKTQRKPSQQFQADYDNQYWASQFRRVGNIELAKQFPALNGVIRRKTKMTLGFLALCLLVAVWSMTVTNLRHKSRQFGSHRDSHDSLRSSIAFTSPLPEARLIPTP